VALALFRDASRSQVLLGIRRDVPSMRRHPNVVSTPTGRIPTVVFDLVAAGVPRLRDAGVRVLDHDGPAATATAFTIGSGDFTWSPAALAVDALITKKLGLADAVITQRFAATAAPAVIALDMVDDPWGTGSSEPTEMLTFAAIVTEGASQIPDQTAAYSRLWWAERDRVLSAMAEGDASLLAPTLDPVRFGIGGLCMRSAVALLSGPGRPRSSGDGRTGPPRASV